MVMRRPCPARDPVPRGGSPGRSPSIASAASMSLLGRDSELAAIGAAIAQVRAGDFRAIVLTGEPGIGKTSVLSAASTQARGGKLAVSTVRAITQERDVPFALAAAVLDAHAGRDVAEAVLPALGADTAPSPGERFRHHRAISAALDDTGRPFALLLDDLQWADAASFEWLLHLLRRPPHTP